MYKEDCHSCLHAHIVLSSCFSGLVSPWGGKGRRTGPPHPASGRCWAVYLGNGLVAMRMLTSFTSSSVDQHTSYFVLTLDQIGYSAKVPNSRMRGSKKSALSATHWRSNESL